MSAEFVVIGLGTFGRNVALNLARAGQSVLAIDRDEKEVRALSTELDSVVCVDSTEEAALRELRVERMSCAVVAIGGESMEGSILTTALLRQLGVPRIVARAMTELHGRVLRSVGAHEVLRVEAEMGQRLARRLAQPNILEWVDLGPQADLVEVEVPESWVESTVSDLDVRRTHGFSILAIRRRGKVRAVLEGVEVLKSGDRILAIGPPEAIKKIGSLS
ncbi:MAG: TrkA family potassium uptake protein [Candidatus Eisenbacteria bacterium]|nr:TrkA family potassium uptake protein [Candidatus Latescibacterota bacterium]MBD3301149.1 TrkA family potassium uptake protein [Candidatus Eisenbacteria bacterium]